MHTCTYDILVYIVKYSHVARVENVLSDSGKSLCDGRKQAWPDCTAKKPVKSVEGWHLFTTRCLWRFLDEKWVNYGVPLWNCITHCNTCNFFIENSSWDLRLQPLSSDSCKCTVNLTHAALSSVELIKLEPVLLNYLQQTFYYIFSNLMRGGFSQYFFRFLPPPSYSLFICHI